MAYTTQQKIENIMERIEGKYNDVDEGGTTNRLADEMAWFGSKERVVKQWKHCGSFWTGNTAWLMDGGQCRPEYSRITCFLFHSHRSYRSMTGWQKPAEDSLLCCY